MKSPRLLTPLVVGLMTVLVLPRLLVGVSILPVSAGSCSVTNSNPSGAGSPRQAILDAKAASGHDTITLDDGAGICTVATLRLQRAFVVNNQVISSEPHLAGGGLYLYGGNALLSETDAVSNRTNLRGGGVFVLSAALKVSGGSIDRNAAGDGGGVYVKDGSATLTGTRVVSSSAGLSGGAFYRSSSTGVLTATNDCIVNNAAPDLFIDKSTDAAAQPGDLITYTFILSNWSILAVDNADGGTLSTSHNWRGAADGPPGAGPGSGDAVSANVDFEVFSTTAPAACPTLASSPLTATGMVITDSVPVSVTDTSAVSAADVGFGPREGTRYVWDPGDVGWGEVGAITIIGVLSEPPRAGTFTNTAGITAQADGDRTDDERSAVIAVVPDSEGDGIPGAVERGAPSGGDVNRDGAPDRRQAKVALLPPHAEDEC